MIRVRLAAIEADQRSSRFFSRIPERSLNCSTRLLRFRTGTGVVKPPHRLTCRYGCAILSKRKLQSSASTPSGPPSVTLSVPITGQEVEQNGLVEYVKMNSATTELELDNVAQRFWYEPSALNGICFIHQVCSMGKHNGLVMVTQTVSRVSTQAQLWRRAFLLQGKARVFPSASHGFSSPLRETGMAIAINSISCG